jgi:hypothetical protein
MTQIHSLQLHKLYANALSHPLPKLESTNPGNSASNLYMYFYSTVPCPCFQTISEFSGL